MPRIFICLLLFVCSHCTVPRAVRLPVAGTAALTGEAFYKRVWSAGWQERDSLAVEALLAGGMPSFLHRLLPVRVEATDSGGGKLRAVFFVTPDYLSVGTNQNWARVPLTPMAAQRLADAWNCFLPTRKMVDDIYRAATVKAEPVPLYIYRDSSVTMWQHHLIIEGQRRQRRGLIAGIKKDVVLSYRVSRDPRPNRVAIYGWHKPDGRPIQPVYTGHVNWYVDYSHGIRLVHRTIYVNGRAMDYTDVLKHPVYRRLLCDEPECDFYRY